MVARGSQLHSVVVMALYEMGSGDGTRHGGNEGVGGDEALSQNPHLGD